MQPSEFLNVAHSLLGGNEASLRTSISRSYYSQFLLIREKLRANGYADPVPGEGKSVHSALREELVRRGHRPLVRKLHNLSEKRVDADYRLEVSIIYKEANLAYRLAEEIESLAKGLP